MKDKLITLAALCFLGLMLGTILDGAKARSTLECLKWDSDRGLCLVFGTFDPLANIPATSSVITITPSMMACDEGWTLVADQSMHPMCARELKEPKR